jgi:hypothetical protein
MAEIKLRQASFSEVLALAADKAYRQEKKTVVVFLPPTTLPPCEPYKAVRMFSVYGKVRIFARPSQKAGWVIEVKFYELNPLFNPVLKAVPKQ